MRSVSAALIRSYDMAAFMRANTLRALTAIVAWVGAVIMASRLLSARAYEIPPGPSDSLAAIVFRASDAGARDTARLLDEVMTGHADAGPALARADEEAQVRCRRRCRRVARGRDEDRSRRRRSPCRATLRRCGARRRRS